MWLSVISVASCFRAVDVLLVAFNMGVEDSVYVTVGAMEVVDCGLAELD
jgi:hypothetical protein